MDRALLFCGLLFAAIGGVFFAIGLALIPVALRESRLFLLFPVMGLAFLLLGVGMLLWRARQKRGRADLLQNGQLIWAELVDVRFDIRVTVNGRCPHVIECQAREPRSGEVYVFVSEGLWFDPSPCLRPGARIPVYVDPEDWRRYAVDTGAVLPDLAGGRR